jgi:dynactin 4
MWSSEEIGIKFDKPSSVAAQLPRIRNGGKPRLTAKERREKKDARDTKRTLPVVAEGVTEEGGEEEVDQELDAETQFANLASFYKTQIAESSASTTSALSGLGDLGFSSPSSLSRIMSMYTSTDVSSLTSRRLGKARNNVMREARTADEGFLDVQLDEGGAISKLREQGWDGTATAEQVAAQLSTLGIGPATGGNPGGGDRFVDTLRPIAYLLRAKRSKRCPICRHIISKPESQLKSSRFRIRLVAVNYVPSITIRPLIKPTPQATADLLTPLKPVQYLLTFKNPIFEPVKVTLATPAVTPGRFASKVTVLCPQFDISANSDEWEVALRDGASPALLGSKDSHGQGGQHQAEAGKIWDRGRNWTSIVVEVVPASLRLDVLELANKSVADSGDQETKEVDLGPLREDEDVLEIPMFVRVEWEAEAGNDEVGATPGERDKDAKVKRELAYWTVLGIGRISQE